MKKVLQKDLDELAYIISQQTFSAEPQVEKDKRTKGEKSGSLQKQHDREIQSHDERVTEDLELIKQLRALTQQMEEVEIHTLKKHAF